MDESGLPSSLLFNLDKESLFSFKCQRCGACCYNKEIPLSPSEARRLAQRLRHPAPTFFLESNEEGKPVLRRKADGSCIFLEPQGCRVYPDRPLVCRLFPLGLIQDEQGNQHFGVMPLHPDCLGLLGTDGTVSSYLKSQGFGPRLRISKRSR